MVLEATGAESSRGARKAYVETAAESDARSGYRARLRHTAPPTLRKPAECKAQTLAFARARPAPCPGLCGAAQSLHRRGSLRTRVWLSGRPDLRAGAQRRPRPQKKACGRRGRGPCISGLPAEARSIKPGRAPNPRQRARGAARSQAARSVRTARGSPLPLAGAARTTRLRSLPAPGCGPRPKSRPPRPGCPPCSEVRPAGATND